MKIILQINTIVNSGSTGRIAEEIGQLILQKGWKSYIAYGRNERSSKSKLIKIGTNTDFLLHALQTRIFDNHGTCSSKATKNLIEQIRLIKPDIIHLHNLHGYYINIKILFSYIIQNDIPVIWTFHDCWPMTGHCTHFEYVDCTKWQTECVNCPQKKEYPASYILDRSKNNYILKKKLFTSVKNLTIVPVSEWLSSLLPQSFFSGIPFHIIQNGIDLEIFKPLSSLNIKLRYNLYNKFIILGVASIWTARKGFNDFIKLSKLIDINTKIILVGLNKKQIKDLPNNIIGITRTESMEELAEFYSSADVFINPTWEDSFPTTNLESLACGTPVITYNTGGSVEAINEQTGFIINKGDISELLKAIDNVKHKGKSSFSNACVNRAQLHFNKNDRFYDYIKLYNSISL